jgi:hypothetical protein
MAFNDDVVDADQAFMGMAISDSNSAVGNVQLWNPYATGKLLYVDRVIINGDNNVGADIRFCNVALSTLFPDHIRNKKIDSAVLPKAQIRILSGATPAVYPYNRPVQEVWLGGTNNDRTYTFDPAIIVPQGRGLLVGMAGNSKCFASWQWREKTDPLGVVNDPNSGGGGTLITGGTVNTDLTNGSNAFDSNDSTFANDADTNNFYIGKIWSTSQAITQFIIKSPSGRSFSGANPGRVLTYTLETWNGTTWTATGTTGTHTEAGGSTQSVINVTVSNTALGHRIRLTDTAIATHRVATLEFYS